MQKTPQSSKKAKSEQISSCSTNASSKLTIRPLKKSENSSQPPISLPNKSSSLSPIQYKSYLSPKTTNNLTPTLQSRIDSRLSNLQEKSLKDSQASIALSKKWSEWASIKTRLIEDFQLRMDIRAQGKIIERKLETFDSDEDDFEYTYVTKLGRIRKFKNTLLGVSKHPNVYEQTRNFQSIAKVPFRENSITPAPNFNADLKEVFLVKQKLARKGIKSTFIDIANPVCFPKISSALPVGGENLIRISDKKIVNKNFLK